jgi:hypothetical protein
LQPLAPQQEWQREPAWRQALLPEREPVLKQALLPERERSWQQASWLPPEPASQRVSL